MGATHPISSENMGDRLSMESEAYAPSFMYFGRCEGQHIGITTLAFQRVGDNAGLLAAAFCAPGDQFTKSEGRAKAGGRLKSKRYAVAFKIAEGEKTHEAAIRGFNEAFEDGVFDRAPYYQKGCAVVLLDGE